MGIDEDLLLNGFMGNVTTLRALQQRCKMTDQQAAEVCMVAPNTYRRWGKDRDPNPTAVRLMAIMAGYLPWAKWQGWEMDKGLLYPPGYNRGGIGPGDIYALPFLRQQLAEFERQARILASMADQAETATQFPDRIDTVIGGGS